MAVFPPPSEGFALLLDSLTFVFSVFITPWEVAGKAEGKLR